MKEYLNAPCEEKSLKTRYLGIWVVCRLEPQVLNAHLAEKSLHEAYNFTKIIDLSYCASQTSGNYR